MASNEIEVLDPAATVEKLKKIAAGRALNRRHFMAALGMTGAAAGAGLLSGCTAATNSSAITASGPLQTDVLNFALNLEFLEATFYAYITQGTDLPSSATANSGAITNAPGKLTFTGANATQITDMLNEIYYDEKSHVADLISLLGSAGIARPAINLGALGAVTATNALSIARLFEDVGVTAYAGAVGLLTSTSLTYAAQILAVESFHSGALRYSIILQNAAAAGTDVYISAGDGLDVPPFDEGSAALAAAGPASTGGFFATAGASNASSTVPAGLPFLRTTSQVLSIVYAAGGVSGTAKGGFFPSGVNGKINAV
jgi:Ferritin-like domain